MPFPREYTPRKRWIMTLAMWLVLAGTLGLAAMLSRAPADAALELSDRQAVGEVSISLPRGWELRDQSIVFVRKRTVAVEPDSGPGGSSRFVAVTVEADSDRFPGDVVSEELMSRGVLDPRFVDPQFRMGPTTGVMLGGDRSLGALRRGDAGGIAVAVARIPGTSRLVRLEIQSGRLGRADVALMRRIADTIEFRPAVASTRPASTTTASQ